jgi:hypothetical protein
MKLVILLALATSIVSSIAEAKCPRYVAPGKFNNIPKEWGSDSGPIVDGFVDSKGHDGSALNALHGIDLAKGDSVDYGKIRDCGGSFAIVRINHSTGRLDEWFARNVKGLDQEDVARFPYYYLAIPRSMKKLSSFESLTDADLASLREKYRQLGDTAAARFIDYVDHPGADGINAMRASSVAGLQGPLVALDVEETPLGQGSDSAKNSYGKLYATTVCQWVKRIRSKFPQSIVLLYTFPAVYGDYLQHAYTDDFNCLEALPVWVARTAPNGWEAIQDSRTPKCGNTSMCNTNKLVRQLCETPAGNRCILHQYTHRATQIATGKPEKGIPPHLDASRFYESRTSRTYAGDLQYVRVVDGFVQ